MSAGMKGLAADLMAVQFEEDALPIVQFQGRPVHLDNVLKYGADRIATLEAEVVRLRGVVEPFARVAKRWDQFAPGPPDTAWMHIHINHPGTMGMDNLTLGDFRRAVLAAGEGS